MADVAFVLGPVIFHDFEVSSGVGFGGRQRLAVHQLPGGTRIIDALGRDDAEITVSGIFSGPDATLRARALDGLRAVGLTLPLTWDVFFYSVIIHDFSADYRNSFWIPYQLACTVVRDEAAALVEDALSLAGSVLSDISAAATQSLSGVDFASAQLALATPNAMLRGTTNYGQASAALASTQTLVGAGLQSAGGALDDAGETLATTADTQAGSAALMEATTSAGQLSALANARGYLGRALTNLANAGT